MNGLIREMAVEDMKEIVKIIRRHDRFDGKCAEKYFEEYFSDQDRMKSSTEKNFVITPASGKETVGICGFMPDKYNTPEIFWITWLYVDKKYHGRGCGAQLLQYVVDQVHNLKARKLYLDTSSDPIYQSALTLYKYFGFQIEGILKDYYEQGEDFIILGKEL